MGKIRKYQGCFADRENLIINLFEPVFREASKTGFETCFSEITKNRFKTGLKTNRK